MYIQQNQICYMENSRCEECNAKLKPFTATVFFDNKIWCLKCFKEKVDLVDNVQEILTQQEQIQNRHNNNYETV